MIFLFSTHKVRTRKLCPNICVSESDDWDVCDGFYLSRYQVCPEFCTPFL